MGRLAGFRYRDIAQKLRACGFRFDRQAAGSHEIWFNAATNLYTTIPNHPGDMPEGTLGRFSSKRRSILTLSSMPDRIELARRRDRLSREEPPQSDHGSQIKINLEGGPQFADNAAKVMY